MQTNLVDKFKFSNSHIPRRIKSINEIRRVESIKNWFSQIDNQLHEDNNNFDWSLIGYSSLFVFKEEGLIIDLLYHLTRQHGFDLIILEPSECLAKLDDLQNLKNKKATMVYLKRGDLLRVVDPDSATTKEKNKKEFQKKLKKTIDSFNYLHPIIFITSVAALDDMNPELREVGYFDLKFEIVPPTLTEMGEDFINLVGPEYCSTEFKSDLSKIGKLIVSTFSGYRRQNLIALTLRRIAYKENRLLNFFDLVNLGVRGSSQYDSYPEDENKIDIVASHEAGHATLAIIDSNGENIPDYATAFPDKHYNGIVADSYAFNSSRFGRLSYEDFRHKIRVSLAGRAAEQVLLGKEKVTVRSASSDLEYASALCAEMFAQCGISPDIEKESLCSNNLAINLNPRSSIDEKRVFRLTQVYLQNQYEHVLTLLKKHQGMLTDIKKSLIQNRILSQNEINKIIKKFNYKEVQQ